VAQLPAGVSGRSAVLLAWGIFHRGNLIRPSDVFGPSSISVIIPALNEGTISAGFWRTLLTASTDSRGDRLGRGSTTRPWRRQDSTVHA